jgi:hypothetical protein
MGYEPRYDFHADLAYGEQGEQNAKELFGAGAVEVKSDRYRNGKMVVETEQKPAGKDWQLSGINVTTADWWVYRLAPDSFFIVSVARLKRYLRANQPMNKISLAFDGDNPARGFLLSADQVRSMMCDKQYD